MAQSDRISRTVPFILNKRVARCIMNVALQVSRPAAFNQYCLPPTPPGGKLAKNIIGRISGCTIGFSRKGATQEE